MVPIEAVLRALGGAAITWGLPRTEGSAFRVIPRAADKRLSLNYLCLFITRL